MARRTDFALNAINLNEYPVDLSELCVPCGWQSAAIGPT